MWAGAVVLVASVAGGCTTADADTANSEDQQETYQHQIERIEIDLDSGDITLAPGAAGRVAVARTLKWNSTRQTVTEQWSGNTLKISTHCARSERDCATDYSIELPADVTVSVRTDAGDVATSGVTGIQELRTGAGDVKVSDATGRQLVLHTDSGRITGSGLGSTRIEAVTDAGDVDLALTAVPDQVTATTSAGNIDLQVPRAGAGAAGYAVQTTTNAGSRKVDVAASTGGKHRVVATTDSGDIHVRYAN